MTADEMVANVAHATAPEPGQLVEARRRHLLLRSQHRLVLDLALLPFVAFKGGVLVGIAAGLCRCTPTGRGGGAEENVGELHGLAPPEQTPLVSYRDGAQGSAGRVSSSGCPACALLRTPPRKQRKQRCKTALRPHGGWNCGLWYTQ